MEAYGLVVRVWKSMTDGGPCIRYGAKKIENFFFVSYALKMILKGFWTCFEDFWFSRSPNPLHDPCIRYGGKKSKFSNDLEISFKQLRADPNIIFPQVC